MLLLVAIRWVIFRKKPSFCQSGKKPQFYVLLFVSRPQDQVFRQTQPITTSCSHHFHLSCLIGKFWRLKPPNGSTQCPVCGEEYGWIQKMRPERNVEIGWIPYGPRKALSALQNDEIFWPTDYAFRYRRTQIIGDHEYITAGFILHPSFLRDEVGTKTK